MDRHPPAKEKNNSPDVIRRLARYLGGLKRFRKVNVGIVSSEDIAKELGVSSAQFRKDLSYFGGFGKKGVGYRVEDLIGKIEAILGIDQKQSIALVGVGRLGGALLGFPGFSKFNHRIDRAFDIDKKKIGRVIAGVKIQDVKVMTQVIKKNKIRIGILCISPEGAQKIAEEMVRAGIKAILNFSPNPIFINEKDVYLSHMDMAAELESLVYFTKPRSAKKKHHR